jgi:hypothetical protein
MLTAVRPAIPLQIPRVAAYASTRDRLVGWTATAVATITALLAILFISLVSITLALA